MRRSVVLAHLYLLVLLCGRIPPAAADIPAPGIRNPDPATAPWILAGGAAIVLLVSGISFWLLRRMARRRASLGADAGSACVGGSSGNAAPVDPDSRAEP